MHNQKNKLGESKSPNHYTVIWRDRIFVISETGIVLHDGAQESAHFALGDIEAIYDVAAGSDIHATDFDFTIFVFAKQFIVVPAEFFFAVSQPFDALAAQLNAKPLLWRFTTTRVPFGWRAWRLNPLACPSVRLAIYDRATLAPSMRTWGRVRGPRTLADYQNTAITEVDNDEYQRRFWAEAYRKDETT